MSTALARIPAAERPIEWRRAWRAISVLRTDPERIDMTFEVMIALDGGQMEAWFQRFLASPGAEELVAERPVLLDHLADFDALRSLPDGSLGRAYLRAMEDTGHTADGLRRAAKAVPSVAEICPTPDRLWFLERNGYTHDLLHVLTGYGMDWAGEISLLAFDQGLSPMRARAVGLFGVMLSAPLWPPSLWVHRYVERARMRGARARIPLAFRWEQALAKPVDELRRELAIEPISAAHPRGILAGGNKFGPWRFVAPTP